MKSKQNQNQNKTSKTRAIKPTRVKRKERNRKGTNKKCKEGTGAEMALERD
jgi:hypothetical protein